MGSGTTKKQAQARGAPDDTTSTPSGIPSAPDDSVHLSPYLSCEYFYSNSPLFLFYLQWGHCIFLVWGGGIEISHIR